MSSINLKIDEERNVVQSFYNGKWNDLDNNANVASKALANHLSMIKHKYRDHSDPLNGSMNFVSPLYRYFGWYIPGVNTVSTKSDDAAKGKRFYAPSIFRWIGDESLSIESLSATGDNSFDSPGTRRTYPYVTEANLVEEKQLASGIKWVHKISGEEITHKANSTDIFYNQKFISTGLYHKNIPGMNLNDNQAVDIVGIQINWNSLPKGSYIYLRVSKHKTSPQTFKLLVAHSDTTSGKTETQLFGKWLDKIKVLDQYDESENYFYYEGMPSRYVITKEEAGKPFTTILLESRGNGALNDSMQGLGINIYIPEEYYYECTRGLDQSEFLWVKDMSKLGKANNLAQAWQEYLHIPSFPKIGDTLKVIESLDCAQGSPKIEYKEYLCTTGFMHPHNHYTDVVLNPSKDIHLDTLRYSYPVGTRINPVFLEYYLNIGDKRDGYFTRYKEMVNVPSVDTLYPKYYDRPIVMIVSPEEDCNDIMASASEGDNLVEFIGNRKLLPPEKILPITFNQGLAFIDPVDGFGKFILIFPRYFTAGTQDNLLAGLYHDYSKSPDVIYNTNDVLRDTTTVGVSYSMLDGFTRIGDSNNHIYAKSPVALEYNTSEYTRLTFSHCDGYFQPFSTELILMSLERRR